MLNEQKKHIDKEQGKTKHEHKTESVHVRRNNVNFIFFLLISHFDIIIIIIIIIIIMIIIIITTLFQEDNIFGTNASLKYGPQMQRHTCV